MILKVLVIFDTLIFNSVPFSTDYIIVFKSLLPFLEKLFHIKKNCATQHFSARNKIPVTPLQKSNFWYMRHIASFPGFKNYYILQRFPNFVSTRVSHGWSSSARNSKFQNIVVQNIGTKQKIRSGIEYYWRALVPLLLSRFSSSRFPMKYKLHKQNK